MKRPDSKYLPALTGVRALAAALVFCHHYFQWAIPQGWDVLREGYIGVTIFFTLSGYLITQNYFERFGKSEIGYGQYYLRRFARIYPTYFVLLTIDLIFASKPGTTIGQIVSNYTLTQAFFAPWKWTGIAPAWSLTIEECFYLMAPALLLLLYRFGRKSLLSTVLVLGGVVGALFAIGARIPAMHLPLQFLQFPFEAYIYSIFGRFEEFAVGVVIALVLARSRKGQAAGWAKELATVLFFGAIAATYADFVGMQHRSGRAYGLISSDFAFVDLLIASFGTAALIWACAKGSRLAHLLLGNPVVEFLGRTSFAFYLLQERLFFEKVHDGIERMTGVNATNPFVMYIGLNVVAAAVYLFLEKPAHRFILNWGSRPKAAIRKLPKRRKALRSAA